MTISPLIKKLGITTGQKIAIFNPPDSFLNEIEVDLPENVIFAQSLEEKLDFIQFFTGKKAELEEHFATLAEALEPAGALWISWPKGTSGVKTDLDENNIREIGLAAGLVDIKVIAVDEIWSGLKFVNRLADRSKDGR
jgi:hypothetical protein